MILAQGMLVAVIACPFADVAPLTAAAAGAKAKLNVSVPDLKFAC
jgi:hypothetical protein